MAEVTDTLAGVQVGEIKQHCTNIKFIVAVLFAKVLNAVTSGLKMYNTAVFYQSYLKMLIERIFLLLHNLLNHRPHISLYCLCHFSAALSLSERQWLILLPVPSSCLSEPTATFSLVCDSPNPD